MKPQCRDILRYMEQRGPITQFDAINRLTNADGDPAPCLRLAARIHDLEHKYGIAIESRRVDGYAVYRLITEPVQLAAFG